MTDAHYEDGDYYDQAYRRRRHDVRFYVDLAKRMGGPVLELGAGTGRYFPFITGETYVGVDICEDMLKFARERKPMLEDKGFTSVELIKDGVNEYMLASDEERFDLVFSIGCVGIHVPADQTFMSNVHRVLKPGGHLYLQTTQQSRRWRWKKRVEHLRNKLKGKSDDYHFFCTTTRGQLQRDAGAAGFDDQTGSGYQKHRGHQRRQAELVFERLR